MLWLHMISICVLYLHEMDENVGIKPWKAWHNETNLDSLKILFIYDFGSL